MNLFMLSGALGFFDSDMVELLLHNEEMRGPETYLLVQRSLYQSQLSDDPFIYEDRSLTGVIRRVLTTNRAWIIEQAASRPEAVITAYGAGAHTRILLQIWNELDLPAIGAIVVTGEPDSDFFKGISVYALNRFNESRASLIVVSSQSFEAAMAAKCRKYLSRTPRLTFWNPDLGTRPKPSLLMEQV